MSKDRTVQVELTIDELMELIDYHRRMYDGIPRDMYPQMTMAGHTLGVTAQRQRDRIVELDNLLHSKWPK
jgi:hypothetical protein